jgi:hypothetical protein
MSYPNTADLDDDFFTSLAAMAARLGASPKDFLAVWYNESGVRATARNKAGNASGIFQIMPAIARGLGWDPQDTDLTRYRLLTATEQLPWAEKYYRPHAGKLGGIAAVYLANFLPALLAHADDMAYVLASHDMRSAIYWANRSFDATNKGSIVVADLEAATVRACQGARWEEILERAEA